MSSTDKVKLFQSTLPRGSDQNKLWLPGVLIKFQSTLPRGSDPALLAALMAISDYFNPRSLAGATLARLGDALGLSISIHAPSRERQLAITSFVLPRWNFNPRSLAGATVIL